MNAPALWKTLLALTTASMLTAALMAPLVSAAYQGQPEGVRATVRSGIWLVAVGAPLVGLIKGAFLAGVAWAVLVLAGVAPGYRRLLGITVLGELILVAQGLWVAVLLWTRGIGSIAEPADLRVTTGLDFLFPDPSTPLGGMALAVTPFHAAWVAFLVWAFLPLARERRWAVGLAALACWLPAAALGLLRGMAG